MFFGSHMPGGGLGSSQVENDFNKKDIRINVRLTKALKWCFC